MDIFETLQSVRTALAQIEVADVDDHDLVSWRSLIDDVVTRISTMQTRKRQALASTRQMTAFIANRILAEPKEAPVRKNELLPGGVQFAVKRRAAGRCELCGVEWSCSAHHIIPRAHGGLDHEDNLAWLCRRCHDNVEDNGDMSRADLLRHRDKPKKQTDERSRAEKAAETRAANLAATQAEERELAAWDVWQYAEISYLTLEQADQVQRPEKPWHVIVYGSGRNSHEYREALKRA